MNEKMVLDREDVRRTLVRIAHEIVEKTGGEGVAIVGIHRRGAVLAARLRDLVAELVGEPVPLGDVDISFYRDDVGMRDPTAQPVVHASHIDFPVEETTVVLVDDVLYTGRTVRAGDRRAVRLRPPRAGAAGGAGRPRPPRAADPPRLRRQEPADRPRRARERARRGARRRGRGATDRRASVEGHGMKRHLLSIDDLSRDDIERILGRAESFAEVSGREIKKVPDAARPHGDQPLLRGLHPHQLVASSWPPSGCRADLVSVKVERLGGGQGRVAQGHRPDAVGLRPGRDRDPLAARRRRRRWSRAGPRASVINAGDGKHEHPTQALLDLYTLRRRVGALEGLKVWIVGDVLHSRVARSNILAFARMGCEVTVCGPPTLIPRGDRVARLRGALHARRPRRGRRGLRPAHAARAHGRLVRALAARVRRAATRSTAAAWAPTSC